MTGRREWTNDAGAKPDSDVLLAVDADPDGPGVVLTTGWKGPSYWTVAEVLELVEALAGHVYVLEPDQAAERLQLAVQD